MVTDNIKAIEKAKKNKPPEIVELKKQKIKPIPKVEEYNSDSDSSYVSNYSYIHTE